MNSHSRRRVEMGTRVLEFMRAHPDSEPGTATVVARLEQLLARANEVAAAQRSGQIQVGAASARKQELRRRMLEVPIAHLAEVGRAAAREEHELGKAFGSGRMRRPTSRSAPRRGGWRPRHRRTGRCW